jgi:uncharacterized membrane protein SirB2
MSYQALKIAHIAGLALTFMGLAGVLGLRMNGSGKPKRYWIFSVAHGVGLVLLLGSGFVLVGQLGLLHGTTKLPGWVQVKIVIWLLAGGSISLATRLSRYAEIILVFFTVLVVAAAWLAIFKPF